MAENPYLAVSIAVYRDEDSPTITAIARRGKQELTRVEGTDLADVLTALCRGLVKALT